MIVRALSCVVLLVLAAAACSSSSSGSGSAGGDGGGAGGCPDVSGAWTVTAHCDPSLVGSAVNVTETSCALTFAPPFDGFTGTIDASGNITLGGPQTCTGKGSATSFAMTCTPGTCQVTLAR
ncbi:MAG: hypothetical protein ACRELB_15840 [Polyangiaceae bacterium]